jgi:hypothetical protein
VSVNGEESIGVIESSEQTIIDQLVERLNPWHHPAPRPSQRARRFAAPARKPVLHLPAHWFCQNGWKTLWDNVIGYHYPTTQPRAA